MADLNFFSPKQAQLLFRQLQKLSARIIAALSARAEKPNVGYHGTPLMQLSVKQKQNVVIITIICVTHTGKRTFRFELKLSSYLQNINF